MSLCLHGCSYEGPEWDMYNINNAKHSTLVQGITYGEIIVWMMRFFRICMEVGRYSKDLKNACTVSVYNDKGDKNDCRNYGGIIN